MIGDILDDVEAGRRAGCRTVLLDVGNETEWRRSPHAHAAASRVDLLDAARRAIRRRRSRRSGAAVHERGASQ